MNDNYHKLFNFVYKVSKPKLKAAALETHMNLDENKGDNAVEIFENGIDNAEAVYAAEARKVLKALSEDTPSESFAKPAPVMIGDILDTGFVSEDEREERVEEVASFIMTGDIHAPLLSLKEVENRHIQDVLIRMNNNRTHAAKALGISLKTLYNKLESGEIKG